MNDMSKVPSAVPDGFLRDSAGRLVPLRMVKPAHKLEDELVKEAFAEAQDLSLRLRNFRERWFGQVDAFLAMLAQEYGVEKGGKAGNITLTSYDGQLRLLVAIGSNMTFGPELQMAKQLVDQCLTAWSEGANDHLKVVVNGAFDVDKEGKLNVERILQLRRLEIDDATWKRAMEAIGDALRVTSTKRYLRFYTKPGETSEFVQVPLDVARA
jgi:hypothetical protein